MTDFAKIEDMVIPSDSFEFGGQTYQLWGLSAADIIAIVRMFGDSLGPVYAKAAAGELGANPTDIMEEMGDQFRTVVGAVIAHAMGSPKHAPTCARIPAGPQLEALEKIIRLTLSNEGGLGKVMEIVSNAAAGAANLQNLKDLQKT